MVRLFGSVAGVGEVRPEVPFQDLCPAVRGDEAGGIVRLRLDQLSQSVMAGLVFPGPWHLVGRGLRFVGQGFGEQLFKAQRTERGPRSLREQTVGGE
ncbi:MULTISPECIES: hypothetical protein [Streptomyces]|uniref:hypothetical protein n=1 Tax=Streptomyces TaxID=1883 RepID=UPI0031F789E7